MYDVDNDNDNDNDNAFNPFNSVLFDPSDSIQFNLFHFIPIYLIRWIYSLNLYIGLIDWIQWIGFNLLIYIPYVLLLL